MPKFNFSNFKTVLASLFFILGLNYQVFAGEDSLYDFKWLDPDKKVYVLQNKVYEKKNSFYANIGYGLGISTDFQSARSLQAKVGYFFLEEWGIEGIYSSISNSDNETYESLSFSSQTTPFIRRYNDYVAAMAIFSPFYGKINTFNMIYYFDINFGLGVSKINGESNRTAFIAGDATQVKNFTAESYTGLIYKFEGRAYLTKNWNVNVTYISNNFKADSAKEVGKTTLYGTQDVIFAVGYSL